MAEGFSSGDDPHPIARDIFCNMRSWVPYSSATTLARNNPFELILPITLTMTLSSSLSSSAWRETRYPIACLIMVVSTTKPQAGWVGKEGPAWGGRGRRRASLSFLSWREGGVIQNRSKAGAKLTSLSCELTPSWKDGTSVGGASS